MFQTACIVSAIMQRKIDCEGAGSGMGFDAVVTYSSEWTSYNICNQENFINSRGRSYTQYDTRKQEENVSSLDESLIV